MSEFSVVRVFQALCSYSRLYYEYILKETLEAGNHFYFH